MDSSLDWRSNLTATGRYESIQRIKHHLKINTAPQEAQAAAFAAEQSIYQSAKSREVYDAECNNFGQPMTEQQSPQPEDVTGTPDSPGTTIGVYKSCHHVASGMVSEVYRAKGFALKVITETHNVDPHNPVREIKILNEVSHDRIINLVESFRDAERRLVLVFPFLPYTLARVLETGNLPRPLLHSTFQDVFAALTYLHQRGIIHRDIKPSNVLLASKTGPARLADFGTAWHPEFSGSEEPANHKVLEVGTTCYRAPETLFGNRSYGTSLDMWSAGVMLAECLRSPPEPLFESRETSEDGNQLGLILSIFKTIGTPTKERWPEAMSFSTPPFEWYREFGGQSWEDLLPGVEKSGRELVARLVCYESGNRMTAAEAQIELSVRRRVKPRKLLHLQPRYQTLNSCIMAESTEPIPLRTLITLLNYERMISDPRFDGLQLFKTSIADLGETKKFMARIGTGFPAPPSSVLNQVIYVFEPRSKTAATISDSPATICDIHPNASRAVLELTFKQRELVYQQTRNHDGCFKASGLISFFFDLLPADQKLSVQLKNEVPILMDPRTYQQVDFTLNGPKTSMLAPLLSTKSRPSVLGNGTRHGESHSIITFPLPGGTNTVVVDMTRMQYGESGRGLFGENYFLGLYSDYFRTVRMSICAEPTHIRYPRMEKDTGSDTSKRMRACAETVWGRWQNRKAEAWCDFCGKPGKDFKQCGGCATVKVSYCHNEHQKAAWKLHKFVCERA